ncbi:sensor histidine kinase [Mesoterricola sediminis]|uniref:histidine kinase n=1 Tax=Mesoterricola sediminis TaxID=2927980 RepID=A0AA48HBU5_9BACT|nr:ATP-binding protein [Mesoterricola sediminis]BDU75423.1 histidine kinase [Mesoterricola sediminis]
MRSLRRTILPLFLALTAWPLPAQGAGHWPVRRYGNDEGLTSEVVRALAQDKEGLIWAGTEAGLAIFEGRRFVSYQGPLPSTLVTALAADPDGSLWVATEAGACLIRDRRTVLLGAAHGLPRQAFRAVGRDGGGHLWLLGAANLYVEHGALRFEPAPPLPGGERPTQLYVDGARTDTLVLSARTLQAWTPGGWRPLALPPVGSSEVLLKVARDGEDGLWLRTSSAMWHRPRGGAWVRERAAMTGGFGFNSGLDRDAAGWVWFDDADGLWRVQGSRRERRGEPSEDAKGGLVDREGGIWIRSDHGILRTLGRGAWVFRDTRDGLPASLTWMLARDRTGTLWAATDKGLCRSVPGGFQTLLPGRILTLALAPDGQLWASGSPGGSVFEVDPATLRVRTHRVDPLPRARVTGALTVDSEGTPWVADREGGGLVRGTRRGQGWTWTPVTVDGKVPGEVQGLCPVPGGGIALLHDGTLSLFRRGRWEAVPGLLPEGPGAVAFGPNGRMAVSYRNRPVLTLHRLGPDRVTPVGAVPIQGPDGADLSYVTLFSLAVDREGRVWVGSNLGVGLYEEGANPPFRMVGSEDRITRPECNEAAILTEGDQVWLGTTAGLALYRHGFARTLERPSSLQRPLILWARAGRLELDPVGPAPRLPRKQNELELQFLVPAYQAPGRLVFEARLQGVDPDWVRLEEPRLRYAGLQAGRYRLDMRGVILDGETGPTLSVAFRVLPAWWETPWARAAGLLLAGAAVALAVRLRSLALQARNRQLQEEVARQTAALQEASRAKSAFLANMSHELRTPLNAILLYAELLQEEARDRGLASTLEDALKIAQAGGALLALIDDILDISKIEAGHMRVEPEDIPFGAFIERLDGTFRPVVERQGNTFVLDLEGAPERIHTDPVRLLQILGNLVGNAAKFTENGRVTLRARRDGDGLLVEVEDTGIGMTSEEQAKVFQEFVQADSGTTRKYGGTGLGLALVRRLTGMLGGTVAMDSRPGEGTRVRIRIPGVQAGPVG